MASYFLRHMPFFQKKLPDSGLEAITRQGAKCCAVDIEAEPQGQEERAGTPLEGGLVTL